MARKSNTVQRENLIIQREQIIAIGNRWGAGLFCCSTRINETDLYVGCTECADVIRDFDRETTTHSHFMQIKPGAQLYLTASFMNKLLGDGLLDPINMA